MMHLEHMLYHGDGQQYDGTLVMLSLYCNLLPKTVTVRMECLSSIDSVIMEEYVVVVQLAPLNWNRQKCVVSSC